MSKYTEELKKQIVLEHKIKHYGPRVLQGSMENEYLKKYPALVQEDEKKKQQQKKDR